MEKFLFCLTIPYSLESVELLQIPTEHIAKKLSFSEREIIQLQVAIEEIITNAVKYNNDKINRNNISVNVYDSGDGVTIKIHEYGIPFDPENFPVYNKVSLKEREDTKGLGVYLIDHLVDKVEYKVLGKDGKEVIIHKKRRDNEEYQPNENEIKTDEEQLQPKTVEHFIVREVNPEETVEVAKEAYYAYGYEYLFEDIYDSKKMRELNKAGEFMSVIAVTEQEEIIGHLAIIKHKYLKNVFEFGAAFVNPKFRGGGTLSQMNYKALEVALREGAELIFVDCVTSHIYSQKAAGKFGFKDTCLFLSKLENISFNEITNIGRRESQIMAFYPVENSSSVSLFLPSKYREIISKILCNLGMNFSELSKGEVKIKVESSSELDYFMDKCEVGIIYIKKFGFDFQKVLHKTLKKLCFKRAAVLYLYMPMNSVEIDMGIEAAEKLDFFFAGVVPDNSKSHYFVMQYMNIYDVDYDMIKINSEIGNKIKEYVMKGDPNLEYNKE